MSAPDDSSLEARAGGRPGAGICYRRIEQFAAALGRAARTYLAARDVAEAVCYHLAVEPCPLHGPSCARVTYGMLREHFFWRSASVASLAASLLYTMLPPLARAAPTAPEAVSARPTVDRTGAAAGALLVGVVPRNRGLRLRVLREQFPGDAGAVTGGVMLVEVGDNRHAADLAGLLHRVVDAPSILTRLWRAYPGCAGIANKNILADEDSAMGDSPD
jgi:hypothetical protein